MRSTSTLPGTPVLDHEAYERLKAVRIRRRIVIAGAVLFALAALVMFVGLPSSGRAIKSDLAAAGEAVRTLPPTTQPDKVKEALHAALGGRAARIDASGFPRVVAVTLLGLDHASCAEAVSSAHRLEGAVVIQLDGYDNASACGSDNDMTWKIMP